ncbi:MAG: hypothetical protein CGU29_13710 [Candidatus Dactylopiibacterium carminicum]|uniref:Uncharacterized protein n=1 Tax=Candidatus Dactylopiibacterium carminicum TaxID=857335 RepID=A0A272EPD2_9RHOO|nr:hypothetical protein BGI27_13780 [Candidatus Dactylopiibacterium carminicum]PAS91973.1 MAG: hypothetical protein CGU29_13710 [Candidatus Dactylopiibacterium carminicum]
MQFVVVTAIGAGKPHGIAGQAKVGLQCVQAACVVTQSRISCNRPAFQMTRRQLQLGLQARLGCEAAIGLQPGIQAGLRKLAELRGVEAIERERGCKLLAVIQPQVAVTAEAPRRAAAFQTVQGDQVALLAELQVGPATGFVQIQRQGTTLRVRFQC